VNHDDDGYVSHDMVKLLSCCEFVCIYIYIYCINFIVTDSSYKSLKVPFRNYNIFVIPFYITVL
jgi:hypothetical protein